MKTVVIGYDGSTCADTAIELVGSLAWGRETSVSLIAVVPDVRAIRSAWGAAIVGTSAQIDEQLTLQAKELLETPAARLRARGLACEPVVGRGRVPQAITELAKRVEADLIVVGSRGRGPIRSTVLGSVSQEVVDLAPSPVLVVRAPVVTSIVFGTDGSPCAQAAEQTLAALPFASGVAVRVVSVAEILRPLAIGIAPTVYHDALRWQSEYEAEALRVHQEIAEQAAGRLRAHGIVAASEARTGDPAAELLTAAAQAGADLIIVGSRGRTGLTRLVLGSVARRVVQHAKASVLITADRAAPDELGRRPASTHVATQGPDGEEQQAGSHPRPGGLAKANVALAVR
jgi:nucleotide-binding universal stress UspA family protein